MYQTRRDQFAELVDRSNVITIRCHKQGHGHGCGFSLGVAGDPWSWWRREEYESEESGDYENPPKNV